MKLKTILIFIMLFAGVFSFSQVNKKDAQGRKHGKWIVKHKGKKAVKYKGVFEHGIPVGIFKFYYESGVLKTKNKYFNNGKDSFALSYHENGSKMSYGKYVNKKRDSVWRYYNESGYLVSQDTYKYGKLHGKSLIFYGANDNPDDKRPRVFEILWYKFGEKEGDWHKFYKNGKMMAEGNYESDEFEGKVTYYYPTGRKKSETHYKHGIKNGWVFNYDGNEKLIKKNYFKNGLEMTGKMLEGYLKRKKIRAIEKAKRGN